MSDAERPGDTAVQPRNTDERPATTAPEVRSWTPGSMPPTHHFNFIAERPAVESELFPVASRPKKRTRATKQGWLGSSEASPQQIDARRFALLDPSHAPADSTKRKTNGFLTRPGRENHDALPRSYGFHAQHDGRSIPRYCNAFRGESPEFSLRRRLAVGTALGRARSARTLPAA